MDKKTIAMLISLAASVALNILGGTSVVPPIVGATPAPCAEVAPAK